LSPPRRKPDRESVPGLGAATVLRRIAILYDSLIIQAVAEKIEVAHATGDPAWEEGILD